MIGGDGINDESNKTAPAPTRNTDLTKYSWCREYRSGGPDALRPKPKGRPRGAKSKPRPAPTREQLLEEENAYLKARVAYLEKVDALLAWRSATGTER